MRSLWRGFWLVMLAVILAGRAVGAQVPTTTVTDTVYRADGTPAAGTVLISWSAFTTAGGSSVAAGSTSVTIGAGGNLTVALAPNVGSTPMGTYYTAVLHLDDGTTSTEFWVVPAAVPGGGPVHVGAIRNSVLPSSVAMQTVSKQYVDAAIAASVAGAPTTNPAGGQNNYAPLAGPTFTGTLTGATGAFSNPTLTSNVLSLLGDSTDAAPYQFKVTGYTNHNQEVRIGYNTASNFGSIQAVFDGSAFEPLELNPTGGPVQVGPGGLVATSVKSGSTANTDIAGTLTLTAGSTATASVTFAGAYAGTPVCLVQPQSAAASTVSALGAWSAQVSATTLSIATGATAASDITFGYVCVARN